MDHPVRLLFGLLVAALLVALPAPDAPGAPRGAGGRPAARIRKAVKRHFRQLGGRHRYRYRRVRVVPGVVQHGVGLYYAIVPTRKLDELYIPVVACKNDLVLGTTTPAAHPADSSAREVNRRLAQLLRCVGETMPDSLPRISKQFLQGQTRHLKPGVVVDYRWLR